MAFFLEGIITGQPYTDKRKPDLYSHLDRCLKFFRYFTQNNFTADLFYSFQNYQSKINISYLLDYPNFRNTYFIPLKTLLDIIDTNL